jgi:tetratricopeptide (TPR) repeat protein
MMNLRVISVTRSMFGALAAVLILSACNQQPPLSPLDAARVTLQAGDANAAIPQIQKVLVDQPASAPGHLLLGQAYFKAGRKDEAKAEFQSGFQLDATATLVITPTDPEEAFTVGNVRATLGQFDPALQAYSQTLQIDPAKAGAYTNMGVVYYQTGKLDAALQSFQQALAIDPKDADTHYLLGAALIQKNNLAEAQKSFQTALTLNPNLAPAYIGLGNVYLLTKDYAQATSNLQQALALQPNSLEALFALGKAYCLQGNTQAGSQTLNQFLQLNPIDPYKSDAQKLLLQCVSK